MRKKMLLYLGALLLLAAAEKGWGQFQAKTFEAYTTVGIMERDKMTPLMGNTSNGDLIQLFWVGPDGEIGEPDSLGRMFADDSLLGTSHIGVGHPFNANEGLFSAFFRHDLLVPGTTVYIRVWNDSVMSSKAAWSNSFRYTINSDFDSHDFGLDFSTANPWIMTGGRLEPVGLASFTVHYEEGHVQLRWATFSETNNLGFHLYRSTQRDSARTRITQELIEGAGNSQSFNDYQFNDDQVGADRTYFYWVSDISADGAEIMHGPISVVTTSAPSGFVLRQNYPNPFNPTTSIPFSLNEASQVRIEVYNIQGQLVREVANGMHGPGEHQVLWDGRDAYGRQVPSGTYLCTMEAGRYRTFIKMTMTK